ncbi:MAG: hypothetical protein J0L65_14700, partial [Xanthomonadales bacterium]|nr:hypothetical protein [Xanthomonadales bacterium]
GEQQSLPTIGDTLTAVRFPSLEPLKLGHEFAGYELQIDGLLEGTQPIVLVDVKLKRFAFEPKEGGSVALTFTASANVDPDELAELSEALIREDVLLTLTPPAKADQLSTGGEGDTLDAQDQADADAEAARLIEAGKQAA